MVKIRKIFLPTLFRARFLYSSILATILAFLPQITYKSSFNANEMKVGMIKREEKPRNDVKNTLVTMKVEVLQNAYKIVISNTSKIAELTAYIQKIFYMAIFWFLMVICL